MFHVLAREHDVRFSDGATLLVESDVPEGKGVSSSAAPRGRDDGGGCRGLAASTIPPRIRAIRCQQVENLIVGAPCGVMDQMASHLR